MEAVTNPCPSPAHPVANLIPNLTSSETKDVQPVHLAQVFLYRTNIISVLYIFLFQVGKVGKVRHIETYQQFRLANLCPTCPTLWSLA